jgi:pimeloyl-ACP methyl ester carboxylesterase
MDDIARGNIFLAPEAALSPEKRLAWVSDNLNHAYERRWWCGWSMGGLHALEAAARDPACQGVIVVAGTPCFMRQNCWPFGFDAQAFGDLQSRWSLSPRQALKRFFHQCAAGEADGRALVRGWYAQSLHYTEQQIAYYADLLAWLASVDLRDALAALKKPIYFVVGDNDLLLPSRASSALASLNDQIRVITLPGVGHVPFAKDGQRALAAALQSCFREKHGEPDPATATATAMKIFNEIDLSERHCVDSNTVVRGFNQAAHQYACASGSQRASAMTLIDGAPMAARESRRILDLGCGTGFLSQAWFRYFEARIERFVGVDAAPNMVEQARKQALDQRMVYCEGSIESPVHDIEQAPWDVIISNFALHWVSAPDLALQGWCERLKPGGWLGIALPIKGSLQDLERAWATVDAYSHTMNFPDWASLVDRVVTALRVEHFTAWQQTIYTEHVSLRAIKDALRQLGAPALATQGRAGLVTPRQLKRVEHVMFSEAGTSRARVSLTYEVGFLWAQKPINHHPQDNDF